MISDISDFELNRMELYFMLALESGKNVINRSHQLTRCFNLTLLAPISENGQTLKQFIRNLPTNCLSVFDHSVGLVLKGTLM